MAAAPAPAKEAASKVTAAVKDVQKSEPVKAAAEKVREIDWQVGRECAYSSTVQEEGLVKGLLAVSSLRRSGIAVPHVPHLERRVRVCSEPILCRSAATPKSCRACVCLKHSQGARLLSALRSDRRSHGWTVVRAGGGSGGRGEELQVAVGGRQCSGAGRGSSQDRSAANHLIISRL